MTPEEEAYQKIDRIVKSREAMGEKWPWIEFKPEGNLLRVCSWCQLNVPPDKQEEIKANTEKIIDLANKFGIKITHGICKSCAGIGEHGNEPYKSVNQLPPEGKIAMNKKWEITKMGIVDNYEESPEESSLQREETADIETDVAKWIGELEYHLDRTLPMEIIGDLLKTPEDFFESNLVDYISSLKAYPATGAYDFIKRYLDEISTAILNIEQDSFGQGDIEQRIMLKKKRFNNSSKGKHEIQILKEFEEAVEDFLNDMPSDTRDEYNLREDDGSQDGDDTETSEDMYTTT